jgi:hypothetical protein
MSQHLFNDTDITAIANAIRTKKGTQNTMTVSQMPSEIASIPSGGGTDYMEQRVQGTLSSYVIPNTCTKISYGAFAYQPITSITIPSSVTRIESNAFFHSSLTIVTIPDSVTYLGNSSFNGCSDLVSVTFSNTTVIELNGSSNFNGCSSLTTLNHFSIERIAADYSGLRAIPNSCFSGTALVGDISLGSSAKVGSTGFKNSQSAGILYIHLTQTDTSLLSTSYNFYSGSSSYSYSFDLDHCRLVVPYSADHSILTAYQTAFPNYSTIMIEETP